jgi:hypothetical protein
MKRYDCYFLIKNEKRAKMKRRMILNALNYYDAAKKLIQYNLDVLKTRTSEGQIPSQIAKKRKNTFYFQTINPNIKIAVKEY